MTFLMLMQVIPVKEALSGFSSEGVISIGVLFVVAKAMEINNSLEVFIKHVLRHPTRMWDAQLRMMAPVALLSGFMSNTPLVAMMIPVVLDWTHRLRFPASKFLIPLSYASVLGGCSTIIGTSTNLIVANLAEEANPDLVLGFFEIGYIGIPNMVVCLIYILIASPYLLPTNTTNMDEFLQNPREFTSAVRVSPDETGPLHGKSIAEAGLRGLTGVFLFEVQRGNETFPAPDETFLLQANDILYFSGLVETMPMVYTVPGLEPEDSQLAKVTGRLRNRVLVELVVAPNSPLVGQTVRESRFRSRYNAAIIAIHRRGVRLRQSIGSVKLQAGDTLLAEANKYFTKYHMQDQDFAMVTQLAGKSVYKKQRVWKTVSTVLILVAMVAVTTAGVIELVAAAFGAACLLLALRCIKARDASMAVQGELLVLIAASFSIGRAMELSGAASVIAESLMTVLEPLGALGILGGVYLITTVMTEVISNAATVTLMFPIAWAMAAVPGSGATEKAVVYTLMMAGSSSFCTPIGYQTNLMVMGPGGYKFSDYAKIGLPLNLISMISTVGLAILIFC